MKINDKHLSAIAMGKSAVDKQGYLLKRVEQNKSFQKKWFILKGNLLFYFEKPSDREPFGVIILHNCIIELSENEELYAFELNFEESPARTYVLAAETQEEMEDWMRTLASVSLDFMKLKLKELEQRLSDLNAERCKDITGREVGGTSSNVKTSLNQPQSLSLSLYGTAHSDRSIYLMAESSKADESGALNSQANWTASNRQQSKPNNYVRSFEEMHRDFGKYIQENVKGALCSVLL